MQDRPRTRKYSRIERERRFSLDRLPPGVEVDDYERLHDLYIEGTALRLRRIETPAGKHVIVKLGQKIPDPDAPDDVTHRQMTTLYLQPGEDKLLRDLPGVRSIKRRYKLTDQGRTFCIDVYEEPKASRGIMLCEVECDSDLELSRIVPPTWATAEVTSEARFSGYVLAGGYSVEGLGNPMQLMDGPL